MCTLHKELYDAVDDQKRLYEKLFNLFLKSKLQDNKNVRGFYSYNSNKGPMSSMKKNLSGYNCGTSIIKNALTLKLLRCIVYIIKHTKKDRY